MILGLFPELSAAGGVQRAGRLTAAVLASFAEGRGERCVFLSLNDPAGKTQLRVGSQEIIFTGFSRSKKGFLLAALGAAFKGPHLAIALHPHLAPVLAAVKICAPRTRTITFAHGVEVWMPLSRLRQWSFRRSDLVLAPSADTVHHLTTQQSIPEEKVRKLPWSLGPEFNSGAPPFAAPGIPLGFPRGRIVLTVGRWDAAEAYKGVDHLIMALPLLLNEVPDVHLVAIGDGSDLRRLTQLAHQCGVVGRVHFHPFLRPDELRSAYDFCDVFALPSRGEGFGLVFLEAMAHAKPVIGGAHGGTPEVVEDGVDGYLVQHGDVGQLVDRLRRLLTNESLRRQMGAQGRERVLEYFAFDRFSAEFKALLQALLES
jgi:phosphatidylinositol alpha-1,6-mannosyltransferase